MTNNTGDTLKAQYWIMGTGIYRPFSPPTKPSEAELICKCETVEQAHAIRGEILKASRAHPEPTVDRMAAIDLNNGVRERVIEVLDKLDANIRKYEYASLRLDTGEIKLLSAEMRLALLAGDEKS